MALGVVNVMSAKRQFSGYLHGVTNALAVSTAPKTVSLTWTDPDDITYNGAVLASWAGTLIVRKANSVPEDRQDGVVVFDSKVRNAYSNTAFEDTGLRNGVTYYYRFFPYDSAGNHIESETVSARPSAISVELPTVTGSFSFDNNEKTPTITYDSENVTATGDLSATNAGEKTITFSLKDDNHIWADGTYEDKVETWTIDKADNALVISKNYGTVKYNSNDTFFITSNPSGGTLSVESEDENWAGAVLNSSQVTVTCNGYRVETTAITIRSAETENYNAASVIYTMTSAKADGYVNTNKESITMNKGTTTDSFTVNRLGTGTITVTSNNLQVLTVNGTDTVNLTALKGGNAIVTVSVSEDDNYTSASVNVPVTVNWYKIMTVKIDQSNSNPETCCTYADDATSMTAGSDEWDEWFGEYPVLFKNGAEVVKINPNNYAQDINGNAIDITSGDAGDVMVAFPIRGLKISTDANDVVTISMTDDPDAESQGFKYYAHSRGSTKKDKFYIGAYEGYVDRDNKLRSLSGKIPTSSKTIGVFRALARANSPESNGSGGSGYDQVSFYPITLVQSMYCLKYKNLNSQVALGKGIVDGSVQNTGLGDTSGISFGDKESATSPIKFLGIENLWGNIWSFIDGAFVSSSKNLLTSTQNFNDTGENYEDTGVIASVGYSYTKNILGTTEQGFLPKKGGGSTSTYFCDECNLNGSCFPRIGGGAGNNLDAGIFYMNTNMNSSNSQNYVSSRLMYL